MSVTSPVTLNQTLINRCSSFNPLLIKPKRCRKLVILRLEHPDKIGKVVWLKSNL